MLIPGLCSVTFRHLQPEAIIQLVKQAGITAIEWGGDVHVPDAAAAREVRAMCEQNGVQPVSYGSYYKAGAGDLDGFSRTVETAVALGASNIRVWAGQLASSLIRMDMRRQIVAELLECGEVAASAGMTLSLEFHPNTLTDTNESAGRLLTELGSGNVYMYWQPRWDLSEDERLAGLMIALQRLTNIHIFAWQADGTRLPLQQGGDFLIPALRLATQDGYDHYVFMEFVQNADERAFLRDAASLRQMIETASAL